MDANYSAEEHFRRGEAALGAEEADLALGHFRSSHRLDPTSPRFRSYYGLALALSERRFDKALELCRSAAKEEFFNPALYHNLALVHLVFGFKAEAIRHLRRGQMIDPGNAAIVAEMTRLGVRRRPVFTFLRRRHVLNRWLGALFRGPEGAPDSEVLIGRSAVS